MASAPTILGRFCKADGTPVSPISSFPADFLDRDFIYFEGEANNAPTTYTFQVTDVRATVIGSQTVHGICIKHYAKPKPSRRTQVIDWLNASYGQAAIGVFALIFLFWVAQKLFGGVIGALAENPVAYFGWWTFYYETTLLTLTSITVAFLSMYFVFKDQYFFAMTTMSFWIVLYLPLVFLIDLLPTPPGPDPIAWPQDFDAYARAFFDTQATALAALKVTVPALIAVINLVGLTVVGKLVDIAFKAAGARKAQLDEENKAKAENPGAGRTSARRDNGTVVATFGRDAPDVEPILRLPLDAANANPSA